MGVPGGGGGSPPPQFVGQTKPVGQYSLQFWKVSPENFFWQREHNPKKSGKFLSAPLFFSFPYAHVPGYVLQIGRTQFARRNNFHLYCVLIFTVVYGINTGFGKFAQKVISDEKLGYVWLHSGLAFKILIKLSCWKIWHKNSFLFLRKYSLFTLAHLFKFSETIFIVKIF